MFDLLNKLWGSRSVHVTGAFPEGFINMCAMNGIQLMSVRPVDDFTLCVRLPAGSYRAAEAVAGRCMCSITEESSGGAPAALTILRRRIVPALCLLLALFLLLWSKLYVWEIEVSGNEGVPTGRILDVLEQCGVGIGCFWPDLTSDNIRSEVIVRLPEISWITVNVHGSRAEVLVRERVPKPEMVDAAAPADIFARKTGFITDVEALIGSACVEKGKAVLAGEMLISGLVESTYSKPRTLHAYGTVTARTYYELSAETPLDENKKAYTGEEKRRYALVIGDKRINFYGNSSIYDSSCDKIYSVWQCKVEGLFSLPVSIVTETSRFYETAPAQTDARTAGTLLEQTLCDRLNEAVGDGKIIYQDCVLSAGGGVLRACLRAECEESIGVTEAMDPLRIASAKNSETGKAKE